MPPRVLVCAICGDRFTCTRAAGCWCSQLSISPERLEELREGAGDCVCEHCLVKESKER